MEARGFINPRQAHQISRHPFIAAGYVYSSVKRSSVCMNLYHISDHLTASTMQIMAEALGLALPGSALLPATSPDLIE